MKLSELQSRMDAYEAEQTLFAAQIINISDELIHLGESLERSANNTEVSLFEIRKRLHDLEQNKPH